MQYVAKISKRMIQGHKEQNLLSKTLVVAGVLFSVIENFNMFHEEVLSFPISGNSSLILL